MNQEKKLYAKYATSDMGSANPLAIRKSDFAFEEHHIICFSHTLHNSITHAIDNNNNNNNIN